MIVMDISERNNSKIDGDSIMLTPAEYVIYIFKSIRKTGRAIGRSHGSVYNWYNPKNKRGIEGRIPTNLQKKILDVAKEQGLDINAHDLIFGRKVKVKFE